MDGGRVEIPGSAPRHTGSAPRTPIGPAVPLTVSVILAKPDPQDAALVESFAQKYALKVTESAPEKRTVKLAGTAGDFERAFGVHLGHFGNFVSYEGPLTIPAALSGKVLAVLGLDNRPVASPR